MYDSAPCNVPPVVPLPVAAQLPYSLSYMLYPLMLVQEKPAVKSSTGGAWHHVSDLTHQLSLSPSVVISLKRL